VSSASAIEIIDITDLSSFELLPPCADPGFDHRSCDYWENEVRGSKAARVAWWEAPATPRERAPSPRASDNPFSADPSEAAHYNPFVSTTEDASGLEGDSSSTPSFNPLAPSIDTSDAAGADEPRKLRLQSRGRGVFGSYAKVLLRQAEPSVYAQFGPLSAYPRAQQIRDLYPRLPQAPLPAVITCVATAAWARGEGLARQLVANVVADLEQRGFSAVEAYPDLTLSADATSSATPAFWEGCAFELAADDDRYPVMRREFA
jgi:ribosomal protein S18 acetylase RimI-like enzyme